MEFDVWKLVKNQILFFNIAWNIDSLKLQNQLKHIPSSKRYRRVEEKSWFQQEYPKENLKTQSAAQTW